MELVSSKVKDGPQRKTAWGTTATGERQTRIVRDAELVITVHRARLIVRGVEVVHVTCGKDGVPRCSVVNDGRVVAPVQEDVVGQVEDVARAVGIAQAAWGEARTVVCRCIRIVVEGVAVRAATSHTRSSHTEDAEAITVGLVVEDLSRVVVDDLPFLLTGIKTARQFEGVAVRVGQAEDVVALLIGDQRKLGVVQASGVHHVASSVLQRVGRSIPSVTKGVEHHELHEGLAVCTAGVDARTIIDSGVPIVVEGLEIGTATNLGGRAKVEVVRTSVLAENNGLVGVDIHEGDADLRDERTTARHQLVASWRHANRVATRVGSASRPPRANHRSVEGAAGNQNTIIVKLVGVAIPTVTPAVEHVHKDHGLRAVRAGVKEARAVVEGGVRVIVEGRVIGTTWDIRRQREGPRLETVVAESTAAGHCGRTCTGAIECSAIDEESRTTITVVVAHGHGVVTGAIGGHAEVGSGIRTTWPKHGVVGYVEDRVSIEGHDAHIKLARIRIRVERNRLCLHRRKKGQSENAKGTSENGSSQVHD